MKSNIETKTINGLLELRKNNMLSVNSEYQRGPVWTDLQQKKLIDSALRGYPLPIIYLHHKKRVVEGYTNSTFEIIDGQQRLNALEKFKAGGLNLLDPLKDDKVARFPTFIKEKDCPWAGLNFDTLDPALQKQFNETAITVAMIETESDDEARDLFIRLQAGLPLNAQEKRDAWPGSFVEFILKFGGKANNSDYPGHNFFKELVAKTSIDRGQVRQFCAQSSMLFFENAVDGAWCDIGTASIDDYYYKNLGFDLYSLQTAKYRSILDKLYSLLGNRGLKKIKGHEAIHLVLLVNALVETATPSWEPKLLPALEAFRMESVNSKASKTGEYWENYVQWTMTSSDSKQSISRRHIFFTEKMFEFMEPVLKDSTRAFGNNERQIVYYRDKKCCAVCKSPINWNDLEIHHVIEHQNGGQTSLNNAVAVHSVCHPKGNAALEFAKTYFGK